MRHNFREAKWYPMAIAACIAVLFYVLLTHFKPIQMALRTFAGYFRPVILGCVIAYIINPLSNLIGQKILKGIKKPAMRDSIANILSIIIVILVLVGAIMTLAPQLFRSVETFVSNIDTYVANTTEVIEGSALMVPGMDLAEMIQSSENLIGIVSDYLKDNLQDILKQTVTTGKNVFQLVIAFILSVYLLSEKHKLKDGLKRLLKASCGKEKYPKVAAYLNRCDLVFNRYIVYNLIDALIVGTVNFLFMTITGMQYKGLVSVVAGVTNLIPTFGPIIGAIIGAFVLLLVEPFHAVLFVIFTLILQFLDGYVIKPRLFGNSLGVSGLWILVGVIVGGNMFGVLGILLAIPVVTILDFTYRDHFLPWLESKDL